jgi:hypothetical protein
MCLDFARTPQAEVRRELQTVDRAMRTFEYGYHPVDGSRCTVIRNTVCEPADGYRNAPT